MKIGRAVLAGGIAAAVLSGVVLLQALALPSARPDELVLAAAMLALIVVALSVIANLAIMRSLSELRRAILARARGEDSTLPAFGAQELREVANAVDRLSARATAREAELRQETAEARVVLHAVTDGILQLDSSGRIVRSNPAASALLGLTGSGVGQPIATLVRNVELRNILQRAATATAELTAEITVSDRRVLVSARPLPHSSGGAVGSVVALTDLTELRRLEGVRRDFVANVSHELKTPLTSIRGYAETLLSDPSLPESVRKQFLEVVQKNAERLHHIVDDLLDLSRFESRGWRPNLQNIEIAPIIGEVVSSCEARAAQRGIRLVTADTSAQVQADPGGLRQVLSNLLDNALRYTPDNGRIEIAVAPFLYANGNGPQPQVRVDVRDNGIGIPSDALPRIFERFYRVDPARSRADGGTGLGLAIVKHLVESMGGDVSAASELGKGTTITVRLPAGQ